MYTHRFERFRPKAIFIGFSVFLLLLVDSVSSCDGQAFHACNHDFQMQLQENRTNQPQEKLIYTSEELKQSCKIYEQFLSCFNTTGCQDNNVVRPLLEGFRDATNYICKEKMKEYIKNEKCMTSNEIKKAEEICVKNQEQMELPVCELKSHIIGCFTKTIGNCCGDEAYNLSKEFLVLLFGQYVSANGGCQLMPKTDVSAAQVCEAVTLSNARKVHIQLWILAFSFLLRWL